MVGTLMSWLLMIMILIYDEGTLGGFLETENR